MINSRLVLQRYASLQSPSKELDSTVFLMETENTLTIFDLFPKAKYHFLVLPRLNVFQNIPPIDQPKTVSKSLTSLRSLFESVGPVGVLHLLETLKIASEDVKVSIEEEMYKTEGRTWPILFGFHAHESMMHIHLHVISEDLVSDYLKNKRHFNTFRSDLGFFIQLDDLIEKVKSGISPTALLRPESEYEAMLKTELECPKTKTRFRNMPTLKAHLLKHWQETGKKL
ncbi:HIT-like domain-containing protein [Melampsora americana]|nr:HIT-like domain-containing protein [Melampsora americana]